jgi:ligand-binding sensor domain-containing protein
VKRHISSQLTFILSIIAFVFLLSDNFMAGEKQWVGYDQKGMQVSAIAIDPVNTSTLYIGTQRGAFRSTDGGSNWIAISKGLKNTDVLSLAIDPVNTRTLYAGTRSGAFKSIDGGDSWALMESCLYEVAVLAIAIDPANTNTLYAIAQDAAWVVAVFIDAKNESRLESKIRDCAFKSTNGGEKWFSIDVGFEDLNLKLESLAIDPSNPSILYAGTRRGVFKSVDRGAKWPAKKCKLK